MSDSRQGGAAARYLRKLSYGVPGARTEAVEASTAEALSAAHVEQALEQALRTFERETGAPLARQPRAELENLFLQDGKRAIKRLKQEGIDARLAASEVNALEAIVEVDGSRPTLALSADDRIAVDDPSLGRWAAAARKFAEPISRAAAAVGRIDLDGTHVGTGFVVKGGLILTNRHVLQGLAHQETRDQWNFRGQPTITFDANPNDGRARQFPIRKQVLLAGPDPIDPLFIDYQKLDFAVLECEPSSGTAGFPAPLPLESDVDKIVPGRPIFTIGYPARPQYDVYDRDVLTRLFQHRYGVKRFAPGEIDRGLGTAEARTGDTVFSHDATTLAGNSGSCVVDFGNDGQLVVGLHFAGSPGVANHAHSNAQLRAQLSDLGLTFLDWVAG